MLLIAHFVDPARPTKPGAELALPNIRIQVAIMPIIAPPALAAPSTARLTPFRPLRSISRLRNSLCVVWATALTLVSVVAGAQDLGHETDIHDFGGSITLANGSAGIDGENSYTGVTFDAAWNMYGTAYDGGANFSGMVWELTAGGVYKDLHDFGGTVINANGLSGPDGTAPRGGVTIDAAGNLYGTATGGGPNGGSFGMVWEITAAGAYIDLHDFGGTITNANGTTGPDGQNPYCSVTFDAAGNLYGTTVQGGPNLSLGMVWELPKTGGYVDLHDFGGRVTSANGTPNALDGEQPFAGVTFDSAGNMFGTAYGGGGNYYYGMVWEITRLGVYRDVHDFGGTVLNANGNPGPDGQSPEAGVIFDRLGNMFGTTYNGGPYGYQDGIVWEIMVSGVYRDLHDFGGNVTNADGTHGPDGRDPYGLIAFDAAGNLFGAAYQGGAKGNGIVWEINAAGTFYDLHDFGGNITLSNGTTGIDGQNPYTGVAFDSAGNLIGTTIQGGGNGGYSGMLWKLAALPPPTLVSVSVSPTTIAGGSTSTGTVTLSGTSLGGTSVNLSSNSASAVVPGSVAVPAGASSATFTINTPVVASTSTATITASLAGNNQTATLTVTPGGLSGLSLSLNNVYGGTTSVGTVTLSGNAPIGGTVVYLSSNSGSATVPASVTVLNGFSSTTFNVSTTGVDSVTVATITATVGSISKTANITINPAVLNGFIVNPGSVVGGSAATGTILLHGQAGPSGISASVSSNNVAATVPATVTIPSGANSGTFTVNTNVVSTSTNAIISVTYGVTTHNNLAITPGGLANLTLSLNNVFGGVNPVGTVTLSAPAPVGGTVVTLSSNNASATVPGTVTVPNGATTATFNVNTFGVDSTLTATITATLGATSRTAALTINRAVQNGFFISPSTVVGGSASLGKVTFQGQAGPSGIVVAVSSNNPAAAGPASITVPFGATSGQFSINTSVVTATTTAILAVTAGSTIHNSLTITAGGLSGFTLSVNNVYGGNPTTGTVTLSANAGAGGTVVDLSSSSANAIPPTSVTVPAGTNTVSFTIDTSGVDSIATATLTASLGVISINQNLTINPAVLAGFTVSPGSVIGGAAATGTIQLNGQAGPSGIFVTVSSDNSSATVPASVTIPLGATQSTFAINTTPVVSTTNAIFTVTYGVATHNNLTITPGGLTNFTLSVNNVYGGNTTVGTVTISAPAPPGGIIVNLSSNNPNAVVQGTVTVLTGSTTASFTINTLGVDSTTLSTITASLGVTSINQGLTINPAVLIGFDVSPSTVASGVSAIGTVLLNGLAGPSGIVVSVASNNAAATVPATLSIPAGASSGTFTIHTTAVAVSTKAILSATYGITTHNSLTITP